VPRFAVSGGGVDYVTQTLAADGCWTETSGWKRHDVMHARQDGSDVGQRLVGQPLIVEVVRNVIRQAVRVAGGNVELVEPAAVLLQAGEVGVVARALGVSASVECPSAGPSPRAYRNAFNAFSALCWNRKHACSWKP
jgi:hypothetical protein